MPPGRISVNEDRRNRPEAPIANMAGLAKLGIPSWQEMKICIFCNTTPGRTHMMMTLLLFPQEGRPHVSVFACPPSLCVLLRFARGDVSSPYPWMPQLLQGV